MQLTINVTQEHIDLARRLINNREPGAKVSLCNQCPVALAIGDAAPWASFVSVAAEIMIGAPTGARRIAMLPKVARDFIMRFDTGKPVEPFSFQIRAEILEQPGEVTA